MADDEDDVYTIETDIPETQTYGTYLSSYRAYTGPQDGMNGVPVGTLPTRKYLHREDEPDPSTKTSDYSESSFIQFRPSSHRLLSTLTAFFCFCPVGIASLVYSCRAGCAKKDGEFGRAAILGKSAKELAVASIVLGVVLLVVLVLVIVLVLFPELSN